VIEGEFTSTRAKIIGRSNKTPGWEGVENHQLFFFFKV
jgi:hypothetical protein